MQEVDEVHHLGILRSVSFSTLSRTTERSTAGRSAFFALNAVGSRFGCLHPITSYKLYSTLSIPIMLYGSELWSLTSTELNILERTHRKILRTIQGLPIRCPAAALQSLIGFHFILHLPTTAGFHKFHHQHASQQLLEARVVNPRAKGITVTWGNLLASHKAVGMQSSISLNVHFPLWHTCKAIKLGLSGSFTCCLLYTSPSPRD